MHYDGIKNAAISHDSSVATWKDLSGNRNDGSLNGGVWNNDNLSLDGLDDGVSIGNKLNTLFSGNNTIEMVLLFEEENTRDDLIGTYNYSWNDVWIGRDNRTGDPDPCLKGKIYSVRVYNRALSNEEVLNNYNVDRLRFNIE